MKTKSLLSLAVALCAAAFVHAEKVVAGPAGGRLLEAEPLRAEFVVNAARRAEIRFYDTALQPAVRTTQEVAVTAEPPGGRVKLEVEQTGFGFATKEALPAAAEP